MDLDEIMTWGRVVRVHANGTVSDAPGIRAPELKMGGLSIEAGSIRAEHEEDYTAQAIRQGWEVMTAGYTGQYGYRGIIMHEGESIGGQLERDILAAPGCYVALEVQMASRNYGPGWIVARRTVAGSTRQQGTGGEGRTAGGKEERTEPESYEICIRLTVAAEEGISRADILSDVSHLALRLYEPRPGRRLSGQPGWWATSATVGYAEPAGHGAAEADP